MTTTPSIPQGDLRLLATATALDLLSRPIPARLAYVAHDGTPRIVPTWFHWDGAEIVMATWLAGPHISHPVRRVRDLQVRPEVAISIDTDDAAPTALQIRGRAVVEDVDAVVAEYRLSAERYLGAEAAAGMLGALEGAPLAMARIAVRPEWVGLLDFGGERLPSPLGGVR
jgi:hypothetical protein